MHPFDAFYGRRIKRRPAETADRPAVLRPVSAPDNATLPLEVEPRSQPAVPEQPRRRGFRKPKTRA